MCVWDGGVNGEGVSFVTVHDTVYVIPDRVVEGSLDVGVLTIVVLVPAVLIVSALAWIRRHSSGVR